MFLLSNTTWNQLSASRTKHVSEHSSLHSYLIEKECGGVRAHSTLGVMQTRARRWRHGSGARAAVQRLTGPPQVGSRTAFRDIYMDWWLTTLRWLISSKSERSSLLKKLMHHHHHQQPFTATPRHSLFSAILCHRQLFSVINHATIKYLFINFGSTMIRALIEDSWLRFRKTVTVGVTRNQFK